MKYKKTMQGAFNSTLSPKPYINLLVAVLMQAKIDEYYQPQANTPQERELIANAGK